MSVQENWQTKRPTVRERTTFMLNNDLFSDVKFVVRKSDDESESMQAIPAHKFVLSISSPVFEAMFYGELAETRDSIELPDCEYESLLELFRYMYSDDVNLSGSNVMGVLYLAKKYMVPSLAEKCTEYLQSNLDPSNVFSVLLMAERYKEKELVDRCWIVIDKQTEAALKSDGFATIERPLLEAVVLRDTLTVKEIDLFKAVDLWAAQQCQKQRSEVSGELKRKILGEKVIKGIRFPVMKEKEFAMVVVDAKILTSDEIIMLFQFFNAALSYPVGFSATRRSGASATRADPSRCARFGELSSSSSYIWYYSGCKDFLSFSVDKDITLHGLCLFGSHNNDYRVKLKITDATNNSVVVSKGGTFSSKLMPYKGSSYYGYEIVFDTPVRLKKTTEYRIEANVSGPESWKGECGYAAVQMSDVTFTFAGQPSSNCNGTTSSSGQFPEFLYSLYTN